MKMRALVLAAFLALAGCGAPAGDLTTPARVPPDEGTVRFTSGGWNVGGFRTESGFPFDHEIVDVQIEVRNVGETPGVPVCYIAYGSQVARIAWDELPKKPGIKLWVVGTAEFPRPLDDYESTDASCYAEEQHRTERKIARSYARLRPGRATKVPDLTGEPADVRLSSYRHGLLVGLRRNLTTCPDEKIEKLLRSYIDPFVPQCGYPRVVGQTPAPGTKATVGDAILVDLAPENV